MVIDSLGFSSRRDSCLLFILIASIVTGCSPAGRSSPSTTSSTLQPTNDFPQSAEQRIARSYIDSGGQYTNSEASCGEILEAEPWCRVVKSAEAISIPEWEELFPTTLFYLVRTVRYGGEVPYPGNILVVELDDVRYGVSSFQRLLDANEVEVSEENRQLIAKSLLLMMLPDFIDYEVEFLSWEEGAWPSTWPLDFNYRLTVWTELRGYQMEWLFMFHEGELLRAGGRIVDEAIGDYNSVPSDLLFQPSPDELSYIKR